MERRFVHVTPGYTDEPGSRLEDAGCGTIVTMTGQAVPGDPQQGYSKILRAAFAEAYLHENRLPG